MSNASFTGGNFIHAEGDANVNVIHHYHGRNGFDTLVNSISEGALHDSRDRFEAPRCHPGTRHGVIKAIMDWVNAKNKQDLIKWLYGPAGSGKSALAGEVARLAEKLKLLIASFFFGGSVIRRNTTDYFIPTLAYQLGLSIPQTRIHIGNVVESDPGIFGRSLKIQAERLIISPLRAAFPSGGPGPAQLPNLIVVDGLDECLRKDLQCELLRVLLQISYESPIPITILVASRPEFHIREIFDKDSLRGSSSTIVLEGNSQSLKDIHIYFTSEFQKIKSEHPLKPFSEPWPSQADLRDLVKKSSGQFVFATMASKYIRCPRHDPIHRLQVVLGLSPTNKDAPFADLDALYSSILSSVDDDNTDTMLTVLGHYVLSPVSWHKTTRQDQNIKPEPSFPLLEGLLKLRPKSIRQIFLDLGALVEVVEEPYPHLKLCHASLADFLFDRTRFKRFFIDTGRFFERAGRGVLRYLSSSNKSDAVDKRLFSLRWGRDGNGFFSRGTRTDQFHDALRDFNVSGLFKDSKARKVEVGSPLAANFWFYVPFFLYIVISTGYSDSRSICKRHLRKVFDVIGPRLSEYHSHDQLMSLFVIRWYLRTQKLGINCIDEKGAIPLIQNRVLGGDELLAATERDRGLAVLTTLTSPCHNDFPDSFHSKFWARLLFITQERVFAHHALQLLINEPAKQIHPSSAQITQAAFHILRSFATRNERLYSSSGLECRLLRVLLKYSERHKGILEILAPYDPQKGAPNCIESWDGDTELLEVVKRYLARKPRATGFCGLKQRIQEKVSSILRVKVDENEDSVDSRQSSPWNSTEATRV